MYIYDDSDDNRFKEYIYIYTYIIRQGYKNGCEPLSKWDALSSTTREFPPAICWSHPSAETGELTTQWFDCLKIGIDE